MAVLIPIAILIFLIFLLSYVSVEIQEGEKDKISKAIHAGSGEARARKK